MGAGGEVAHVDAEMPVRAPGLAGRVAGGVAHRRGVVPQCQHHGAVVAPGHQGRVGVRFQLAIAQLVQHREGVECGLGDASRGDQAEAAVERIAHDALFLEHVGERPVAHDLDLAGALADRVGHPRPHEHGVGDVGQVGVAGVVLAEHQRHLRVGRGEDLLVHLVHRAADHVAARDVLVAVEHVLRGVVAVDVGAEEIDRHVVLFRVRQEIRGPRALCGGRPADAQARVHRLQRAGGVVVQRVVGGLLRLAGPEADVRLVPHLEVPAGYLVDAVTRDQVAGEGGDHRVPLGVVLRRRAVGVIPELLQLVRVGGQCRRHEAQLDEGLHAVLEQAVVDLVDVGEVVADRAVRVAVHHAHVVVEDAVEADVAEAGSLAHGVQVLAVIVAQRQRGAAGAEHGFPEVRERRAGGLRVDADLHGGRRGREGGANQQGAGAQAEQEMAEGGREAHRGIPRRQRSLDRWGRARGM